MSTNDILNDWIMELDYRFGGLSVSTSDLRWFLVNAPEQVRQSSEYQYALGFLDAQTIAEPDAVRRLNLVGT